MNIPKLLHNPWVLGGAGALVLVIVLASKSGGSGSTAASDPNLSAAYAAQSANNQAGLTYAAQMASINADTATHAIDASTTDNANILSALTSMFNAGTMAQTQQNASAAGVTSSIIQANTALATEYSDNATRLAQSYVSASVATAGYAANENIASNSAFWNSTTSTTNAQTSASSQALSALLGSATKILTGKVA